MNMIDMYTRAKVNAIHLEKMQEEAKAKRLLHKAGQGGNPEGAKWLMNSKFLVILLILLIRLLVSGCTLSAPNNPALRSLSTRCRRH